MRFLQVCLVVCASLLVHASPASLQAKSPPEQAESGGAPLTKLAREMREMILEAVVRGSLEELAVAIEWNELPPDFGGGTAGPGHANAAPIDQLVAQSEDGSGYDILATLGKILTMQHAAVPRGADAENPNIFVFPYLAARDLSQLTPGERVDLYRLMPARQAAAMIEGRQYTDWVLTIGADGTWHSFRRKAGIGKTRGE